MIKKWLSYLLIALIALQSVSAIAGDEHQSHQDGEQHLEFDHGHESTASAKIFNMEEESYSYAGVEFDCHHCCHCHGTHLNYVPTTSSSILLSLNSLGLNGYDNTTLNGYIASLFRPPKV